MFPAAEGAAIVSGPLSTITGLMVRDAVRCPAPHHEVLRSYREKSPHPEEPAAGGRLEGWAAKDCPGSFPTRLPCIRRQEELSLEGAASSYRVGLGLISQA